ncbi:DM13 domain-containing protein [Jannaschia sp. S6380]|uniref:DM13 domain-containing protein n=1 Tax=Jannaschia sp. S6380 TaxID=2926408 RepID=UPI001FF18147|nr:DM13 domain-containing protein [Jannaschia sp. S6380]MCK0168429.1 DM13 domain-containing protein [Jannaschia sp. S6380]
MNRRSFLRLSGGLALLPAATAIAGGHGRLGSFAGASNHVTTGTAEIAGNQVNLLADFTFDGAPDPKVALGRDGYDPRTLMGPLQSNSGASSYAVPAGVDASQYNEVWIWCEKFNVPLGVAKLN